MICLKNKEFWVLYDFLKNCERYCLIAFDTQFCGFNPLLKQQDGFDAMVHMVKQVHNFYKHFVNFLTEESCVIRKTTMSKFIIIKKGENSLDLRISRLISYLRREFCVYKTPKEKQPIGLENKIVGKIEEDYLRACRYKIEKLS